AAQGAGRERADPLAAALRHGGTARRPALVHDVREYTGRHRVPGDAVVRGSHGLPRALRPVAPVARTRGSTRPGAGTRPARVPRPGCEGHGARHERPGAGHGRPASAAHGAGSRGNVRAGAEVGGRETTPSLSNFARVTARVGSQSTRIVVSR